MMTFALILLFSFCVILLTSFGSIGQFAGQHGQRHGDGERKDRDSHALSSLLQSTLIKKDELIPFDDELRNLKNYCDIQQLRYAGRFEMEYQIEDAAGYWTVPRFILQPLVENSILHGTADEDDFVTITVRATVSENLLTIHISDTGCGFDPRAIKEKNSERFSGIGLSNVDERMRLHYGNEYGLTIESAPGIGTQCILCIPNEAIR